MGARCSSLFQSGIVFFQRPLFPLPWEDGPLLPAEGSLGQSTDRPGGMSKMGLGTLAMGRLLQALQKSSGA